MTAFTQKIRKTNLCFRSQNSSYFWGSQNSLWARGGLLGCACIALCLDLRDGDMSIFKLRKTLLCVLFYVHDICSFKNQYLFSTYQSDRLPKKIYIPDGESIY